MAIDASFEKILELKEHPKADKLEVAIVSGYQVCVAKGQYKAGQVVLYVRDDARLITWDMPEDEIPAKFGWQKAFIKYLGSAGKVQTVRLRGIYSSGFLFAGETQDSPTRYFPADMSDQEMTSLNELIYKQAKDDTPMTERYLSSNFGICHWSLSEEDLKDQAAGNESRGVLANTLPLNIRKTDEELYQNLLSTSSVPLGTPCLVTKKLDGTSTTFVVEAGTFKSHVCSRSQEFNPASPAANNNLYFQAAAVVIPLMKAWVAKYNITLICQGELTHTSIQRASYNADSQTSKVPTFHLFRTIVKAPGPDGVLIEGTLGSPYHFLAVNKEVAELTGGQRINTVPCLSKAGIWELPEDPEKAATHILTLDLLESFRDAPREKGEGVVINHATGSFKAKSLDYLRGG